MASDVTKCPFCGNAVLPQATVCGHCNAEYGYNFGDGRITGIAREFRTVIILLGITLVSFIILLFVEADSSTGKTIFMMLGILGTLTGLIGIRALLILIVALVRGKKWWR